MFTHLVHHSESMSKEPTLDADTTFHTLSVLEQELTSLNLLGHAIDSGADVGKLMTSTALASEGIALLGEDCATLTKDECLARIHSVQNMGNTLQLAVCTKVLVNLGVDPQSIAALEELTGPDTADNKEESESEIAQKKSLTKRYLRLLSRCVVLLGVIGLIIHKYDKKKRADARALREYRQRREDSERQREKEMEDEYTKRREKRAADRRARENAEQDALNKIREREYEKAHPHHKEESAKFAYGFDRIPGSTSPEDLHYLGMKLSTLGTFQNTIVSAIHLGGPLINLKDPEKAITDIKKMESLVENALRDAKRIAGDVGKQLEVVAQKRGPTQKEIDENALEKAEAYTKHQKERMMQITKDLSVVSAKMIAEYAKHSFIPESFKTTLKNIHEHAEKLLSSSSAMDATVVTTKQIGH